jgi:hypothetical protein
MIPTQSFHCPRCGAPGLVNMGQAEYSCQCRFSVASNPPFQCQHIPIYDNAIKGHKCQVCGARLYLIGSQACGTGSTASGETKP